MECPSFEVDLNVFILKQPSPETNPVNQESLGIIWFSVSGLIAGTVFGKAFCNYSDKPKFIEALMLINSWRPSGVKCFLLLIRSIPFLYKIKSAFFLVIKGYASKWGITISTISFKEDIR